MDTLIAVKSGHVICVNDVMKMYTEGDFLVIRDKKKNNSYFRLEEVRFAIYNDSKISEFFGVEF